MPRDRRVVHLTSAHPPLDVRIFHKECASLARAGYEVILIAAREQQIPHDTPVRVVTVRHELNRFKRMTLTVWRVYRMARRQRASIYHIHDPELIPAGILLCLEGFRVIYDAHESLPRQVLGKVWLPTYLRPLAAFGGIALEHVAARFFAAIVAATPPIAHDFPPGKTVVVQNFPVLSPRNDASFRPYGDREHTATYVGLITRGRGAAEMIDAIALVPSHLKARLLLIGAFGPPHVMAEMSKRRGWDMTIATGWTEPDRARQLMSACRIGLVIFHPEPNHLESYPTKMFEYMAAGLPIIASDFPLWRRIVEEAECGLLVDPRDPAAIGLAITHLLEDPTEAEAMGTRGRTAVQERYTWEPEEAKLLGLYSRLLLGPSPIKAN